MTPDMSRELAQLVGQTRARLTIFDRRRIWEAASGVDSLDQLPEDVQELLDRLRTAPPREAQPTVLTAASEVHTGAMIALVPTEEDAERLAVDGGEEVDELHLTLAYLGETALIPEEVQHDVIECVARCAADRVSIVGNAFAIALFNPETGMTASTGWELDEVDDLVAGAGGPDPCVVLLVAGQQLPSFQEYVVRSVAASFGQAGMKMHEQHSPWVAHLTLAYTDDADLAHFLDRTGPVTFDRVRVAFGGDVYDIPLGESVGLTSTDKEVDEQ